MKGVAKSTLQRFKGRATFAYIIGPSEEGGKEQCSPLLNHLENWSTYQPTCIQKRYHLREWTLLLAEWADQVPFTAWSAARTGHTIYLLTWAHFIKDDKSWGNKYFSRLGNFSIILLFLHDDDDDDYYYYYSLTVAPKYAIPGMRRYWKMSLALSPPLSLSLSCTHFLSHTLPHSSTHYRHSLTVTPGAYSIKIQGSVNYGFVITAKFRPQFTS